MRICSLISILLGCVSVVSCGDDYEHRQVLESLVRNGATQEQVVERLGSGVTTYERGTPSWTKLKEFLAREPESALEPLRKAVDNYPLILYYTTESRMTWLFLDERRIVRAYYLTSQ